MLATELEISCIETTSTITKDGPFPFSKFKPKLEFDSKQSLHSLQLWLDNWVEMGRPEFKFTFGGTGYACKVTIAQPNLLYRIAVGTKRWRAMQVAWSSSEEEWEVHAINKCIVVCSFICLRIELWFYCWPCLGFFVNLFNFVHVRWDSGLYI